MSEKIIPVYVPVLEGELLKDRVALITGATSGIGFAIASSFLKNGASVVITGRNPEKLTLAKEKLSAIQAEGFCETLLLDNKDIPRIQKLGEELDSILPEHKKINLLVNNAGIAEGKSFSTMTEEVYDAVLDTNLKGVYFMSQALANYMIKHNIKGNILNVASSSSLRPALSPYVVSKWGIRGLTEGLAKALIPYQIVVNGIAPGQTITNIIKGKGGGDLSCGHGMTGRYITAEEVANFAVMLSSDMGRMIVGDIVYMTGGAGNLTLDDVRYTI